MRYRYGLSLIEILIALAILGILMAAVVQVFVGTMRVAADANAQNNVLHEAQVAMQIITARLNEALYIVPAGTALQLSTHNSTANTVGGSGTNWTVGTHPMLALVLPPEDPNAGTCNAATPSACPRFFAYYPLRRSHYLSSALPSSEKPDTDAVNDLSTWVLMEYRGTFTSALPAQLDLATFQANFAQVQGNVGRLLADYVQPQSSAPTYTMFSLNSDKSVSLNLRMLQLRLGKEKRVSQFGSSPLETRVYPRNWN